MGNQTDSLGVSMTFPSYPIGPILVAEKIKELAGYVRNIPKSTGESSESLPV